MTESETEKPWEKPWDPQELINSSNNWSLAGDAGLLLYLKKFSDNFMTKAANIEKDLQKLTFEEQQCHVKFENVITNFLQLENTQFIENRVYEQDVTTLGTSIENEKIEKTKEEKEQDLFEVITESVQIGMSIMDTYFDKIDGSKLDESEDEDDQYRNEDLVIYETKDPYVLRSLPYLIGSEAYLENDHVGLKDLEDEIDEEEEEEEEEENEEQVETENELETESEQETNDSESESEKDELFSNAVKNDDLFDDGSEEEQTNLFSVKIKADNLFDDDDDDDDNESEAESKSVASSTHSDSQSNETTAAVTEKPLDFASELRRKLAMKPNQNTQNESLVNQKNNEIKEPVQQKQKIIEQKHSDLFGKSESDSDSEGLFSKPSTNKQTLFDDLPSNPTQQVKTDLKEKNTIFDDEDEEDDNDLFSKPSVTQTKKSSEINKVLPNELDSSAKINKTNASLFDSDDDDDDDEDDFFSDKKVEIKPIKPAVQINENLDETMKKNQFKNEVEKKADSTKSDLFENQKTHSEPKSEQNKIPVFPSPKVNSLFDDDSDDDDLFSKPVDKSKLSENKISLDKKKENNEIKSINKFPVPKTTPKSLFDDENEDDDDDLFSKPKNEPKMSEVKPIDINEQTNKSKIKNQTMDDKLEASKTVGGLFNDQDEDDDDDLFSKPKNEPKLIVEKPIKSEKIDPISNKVIQAPKTTGDLFDDDNEEDDLFSKRENKSKLNEKKNSQNIKETIETDKNDPTSNKVIQAPKATGGLFDDDDNEDDDLFSKPTGEKSQPNEGKVKIDERNILKSETEMIKPKPVVKNVLFDPLALKSSGLFKKLAQNNDSEDDVEIEDKKNSKNEEIKRPEIETEKSNNFFSTTLIKTNSSNLSSNQESTDSFDDILASAAPIISTVQKDRIKAVSAKKRPPTKQRKQTLETENVPEVLEKVLSSDNQFKERIEVGHNDPKQVNLESELASKSENVKDVLKTEDNLTKTKIAQSSLFDNLDEDDDDIFKVDLEKKKSKNQKKLEPKSKETKVVNKPLFDNLDDDIFNINSKVIDEKKSIKNNDNSNSASNSTVKQEAKKNIFDDLDDFEDIFASVPKKKPEKKKPTFEDSIFD